ncbi:hypothetical protein AMECASPLE_036456 [Ameca splendens]|uniref:Uncharacterized protein n=1 Tax=Ameca splendens TaxID=208324 RepID=A0ABV0Z6F6_9TELE
MAFFVCILALLAKHILSTESVLIILHNDVHSETETGLPAAVPCLSVQFNLLCGLCLMSRGETLDIKRYDVQTKAVWFNKQENKFSGTILKYVTRKMIGKAMAQG